MSVFKYTFTFVNLIIWSIQPANAQTDNPCPSMGDYQISFPISDLNVYQAPNVNSEIIAKIPAGRRFSLSDISPRYYDDFCWYKVVTFSVDERGWIGFELKDGYKANQVPNSYDNPPQVSPESKSNLSLETENSPVTEQIPRNVGVTDQINIAQQIANSDIDLVSSIVVFLVVLIGLTIIVAKIVIYLLSVFAPPPQKKKINKRVVNRLNKTIEKSIPSVGNNDLKNGVINVIQTEFLKLDHTGQTGLDSIVEKDVHTHFLLDDFKKAEGEIEDSEEIVDNSSNSSGLSLEYYISNFNQGNKEFFEDETQFNYLKPTESFIYGLEGDLGLGDRQEFEIGKSGQASYLAFTTDGEIWLIPNLIRNRWPGLLTTGTFFDVYSDLTSPKLVRPARLTLIGDRRWQIIEKGSFN